MGTRAQLIRVKRDVLGRRYYTLATCLALKESVLSAKEKRVSQVVVETMLKDDDGEWEIFTY